ncbi:MAG: ubiquitin-like small modifier protein 1 [Candidatus Nanopelagicales bacterium]
MSVTVRIPTILRTYTGDSSEVVLAEPGATLGTALEALEAGAPGIQARILDDEGNLRRFVNVYVDDEDVRFLDGLGTEVKDGATITVIPAVAGG